MTREQLKSRVQGIDAVSGLSRAVEMLGAEPAGLLVVDDIRLHDAFRRLRTIRRQVDIGTSRAADVELASKYTSDLQQLISAWA